MFAQDQANEQIHTCIEIEVVEEKDVNKLATYEKDNRERQAIMDSTKSYMKKYQKDNFWITCVRLVLAVAIITGYLLVCFLQRS